MMIYWLIIGSVFAWSIGLLVFRRHIIKQTIREIQGQQDALALDRVNKVREKEAIINEQTNSDKEYLTKNHPDWPDSGVIELPKEGNGDAKGNSTTEMR